MTLHFGMERNKNVLYTFTLPQQESIIMKRDNVFKNVAFGGGWSERISAVEKRIEALSILEGATTETAENDLRLNECMIEALDICTRGIPRGDMFRTAWMKALSNPNPALRGNELKRLYSLIKKALGTSAII